MSSYADIASHGPSQTDEEKRAPAPPQLSHSDSNSSHPSASLPDVDSPHISSLPSDYSSQDLKTSTQSARESRENDLISMSSNDRSSSPSKTEKGKQKASEAADQAKRTARDTSAAIQDRTGRNPIALGNMVLGGVLATALGLNVYQRWQSGQGFGARFVGTWVGVVAAVGAGDFLLSRWAGERGYGNDN